MVTFKLISRLIATIEGGSSSVAYVATRSTTSKDGLAAWRHARYVTGAVTMGASPGSGFMKMGHALLARKRAEVRGQDMASLTSITSDRHWFTGSLVGATGYTMPSQEATFPAVPR